MLVTFFGRTITIKFTLPPSRIRSKNEPNLVADYVKYVSTEIEFLCNHEIKYYSSLKTQVFKTGIEIKCIYSLSFPLIVIYDLRFYLLDHFSLYQ